MSYHPDYPEVTPAQVATFDQAHADVGQSLDVLIGMYRRGLADGEPAELTIVAQGRWLAANFERVALAEHLTVAIARLAKRPEGYEQAVSTLRDVAQRTGSPAARWAADYLAADPDGRRSPK